MGIPGDVRFLREEEEGTKAWGRKEMSRSISTPSGWGNVSLPGQLLPAAVSTQGGGSP